MKSVIGIDPGGRSTGIVLMVGGKLVDFAVIERKGKDPLPDAGYLREVGSAAGRMAGTLIPGYPLIAVEGLSKPTGFRKGAASGQKGFLNPLDLAGPAMVIGALVVTFPGAVMVEPRGNGSKEWFAYPEQIRPKPGGKGADRLRHARSAWDVALAGLTNEVLRSAQAPSKIGL